MTETNDMEIIKLNQLKANYKRFLNSIIEYNEECPSKDIKDLLISTERLFNQVEEL